MLAELIIRVSQNVEHVNRSPLDFDPTCQRSSAPRDGVRLYMLSELGIGTEVRRPPVNLAI